MGGPELHAVVDEARGSAQTPGMLVLLRFAVLALLGVAAWSACPDPTDDDDTAANDDDSAAADDDDGGDDDDATTLPPVEDAAGLVDGYWELDLTEAEYVEPPNMAILLGAAIGDLSLLFGVAPESDLEAGEVHILGALGDDATEDPVLQDLCRATQPFTAGPDGEFATADDTVGEFINPAVRLDRFDYDLVASGTIIPLTDVQLTFGFTPDGARIEMGRLRATMDTRPISLDILNNEDPYRGCEIIFETSKRECFECGGDAPGNFCIGLEIADLPGTRQGSGLVPRRCEEIIREDLEDVGCDGRAEDFQREGEDGYPLCPAYTEER